MRHVRYPNKPLPRARGRAKAVTAETIKCVVAVGICWTAYWLLELRGYLRERKEKDQ